MDIETINPHVLKILMAARREDSINAIAKRTGLSYGWAYFWIQKLIKEGIFAKNGKLILQEENGFYKSCMSFIKRNFSASAGFHYYALRLFGIKYCFTSTDAVYIWTDGGYNIARYRDYYPIFIKLGKNDYELFGWHCKKLGLKIGAESGIFYKVERKDDFPVAGHKGMPVDSLEETIAFMKKYVYNFQPALEMIAEIYGKEGYEYKEVNTYV